MACYPLAIWSALQGLFEIAHRTRHRNTTAGAIATCRPGNFPLLTVTEDVVHWYVDTCLAVTALRSKQAQSENMPSMRKAKAKRKIDSFSWT